MKSITDKNSLLSQCHTNEDSSQKLKTMNTAPLVIPLQSDCCRATMSILRRTLQEWNVRVSIITFLTVKTGHETGLTDVSATGPAQLVQTEELADNGVKMGTLPTSVAPSGPSLLLPQEPPANTWALYLRFPVSHPTADFQIHCSFYPISLSPT